MPRRKKELPDIGGILASLEGDGDLGVKYFPLSKIPEAVAWAEKGFISIHENYHSRRRQTFHVISGSKERLEAFCRRLSIDPSEIRASEYFRFWHLTWSPQGLR